MKKLTILFAVFVLGSTQIFASNDNSIEAQKQLMNQVTLLLENPEIHIEDDALNAKIEFTLNDKGEIVVLSVDAKEDVVKNYVRSRLNYKKVDSKIATMDSKIFRVFRISLKILKPQV